MQYPTVFDADGLFGTFPYLAPSLFTASVILTGITLAYIYVEENPKEEAKDSSNYDEDTYV